MNSKKRRGRDVETVPVEMGPRKALRRQQEKDMRMYTNMTPTRAPLFVCFFLRRQRGHWQLSKAGKVSQGSSEHSQPDIASVWSNPATPESR